MIPSVIEREVLIEAPVEVVWRTVTEPGQISRWFSDAAEIDRVGREHATARRGERVPQAGAARGREGDVRRPARQGLGHSSGEPA